MTTAYFKNTNTSKVISILLFFNFKFVILPKIVNQGNKTNKLQRAYRECLGTKRR